MVCGLLKIFTATVNIITGEQLYLNVQVVSRKFVLEYYIAASIIEV